MILTFFIGYLLLIYVALVSVRMRGVSRLLPRLSALACYVDTAQAASVAAAPRFISTSAAAQAPVHIEDEVYNRTRQLVNLGLRVPTLAPDTWVAPNAVVVGDVDLFERVRICCMLALRVLVNCLYAIGF